MSKEKALEIIKRREDDHTRMAHTRAMDYAETGNTDVRHEALCCKRIATAYEDAYNIVVKNI